MALKSLNAEHLRAVYLLALPKEQRPTIAEIAKECGVSEVSIYNWKKDDLFVKALKKEIVRNSLKDLPDIFASVPKHIIEGGNAAMFKTLLQAHDMLTDRVEVEQTTKTDTADAAALKARIDEYKRRLNGDKGTEERPEEEGEEGPDIAEN
jgi:hypothetical protein